MLGLLTNVNSLTAQNDLTQAMQKMNQNMQQLSTGKQINSAVDNPAGLAISQRLQSQVTGAQTGNRNISEGIALSQTAEGGLQVIQNQLQKLRQLAIEAQNGTNSSTDANALQQETNQMLNSINHIAETTSYNGINLLSGYANPLTQEKWSASTTQTQGGGDYRTIAFGNGKFVALDYYGYAYTSTDGIHWTQNSTSINTSPNSPNDLIWNGKEFVAGTYSNAIYTSTDGVNWIKHSTPINPSNIFSPNVSLLTQIGNETIAVDSNNGTVFSSTNGTNWNKIGTIPNSFPGGSNAINDIAYGNGKFIAIGNNGSSYVSSDGGKNWFLNSIAGNPGFTSLTWNGENFIAVTDRGSKVLSSSNGVSWSQISTLPASSSSPFDIQYLNGTYYVSDSYNGNVYESTNGVNWITQKTPSQSISDPISGLAYGHDQLVSMGYNSILQSTPETASINIQTGSKTTDQLSIQLSNVTVNSLGIQDLSLTSPNALRKIDHAINATVYEQQKYGQFQTVLSVQQQNNLSQAINEKQTKSTITNANMTQQMSELTKNKILMQTDLSMLNQANQQSKIYLMLYNKPAVG